MAFQQEELNSTKMMSEKTANLNLYNLNLINTTCRFKEAIQLRQKGLRYFSRAVKNQLKFIYLTVTIQFLSEFH